MQRQREGCFTSVLSIDLGNSLDSTRLEIGRDLGLGDHVKSTDVPTKAMGQGLSKLKRTREAGVESTWTRISLKLIGPSSSTEWSGKRCAKTRGTPLTQVSLGFPPSSSGRISVPG